MTQEVLKLQSVSRIFHRGTETITALDDVSITITQGELVAIIGPSGSGKSTMMSVMGCLDGVDAGQVFVLGQEISAMPEAQIARIRAVSLGFVFQSYHLLADLTALENVALAGLYAGVPKPQAHARAEDLLRQVGLGDRLDHLPTELSGGQQQRVAVARALFHEHSILLADEPTGALDSTSSENLMALFQDLSAAGRTIVIVTHDPDVAAQCHRTVQVKDGRITTDKTTADKTDSPHAPHSPPTTSGVKNLWREALVSALSLMWMRLTRTLLTLIGTIIGITAVIVIVALGDGAKQTVVDTVGSLGRDLIVVMADYGTERPANSGPIQGFSAEEQQTIAALPEIRAAVREMPITRQISAAGRNANTLITGTEADFPIVHNWPLHEGSFFTPEDERAMAPVVVIGTKVKERLFPDQNPIGQWIAIETAFFEVIGVMTSKGANPAGVDLDDVALVPFSSAVLRLGQTRKSQFLMVKTIPDAPLDPISARIESQIITDRGTDEIAARTLASIVELELKARSTLTALLTALGLISLLVGAVGITNITLISVVERTREIGLRKALGARRQDIAVQFLIETTVTSIMGGILGVLLGLLCVVAMQAVGFPAVFNIYAITAAIMMSALTGTLAGVVPARRAAALHPVDALLSA